MKTLATIVVVMVFTSATAYGAGYGGARGKNRLGQTIHIQQEVGLRIYIENKSEREWVGGYNFDEECREILDDKQYVKEIVCKKNGKSPLAGATYKVIPNPNQNDCDYAATYKCIDGCQEKRVPLEIVEGTWECGEHK